VVTKRLAELMKGVIGVESAPKEGSTFWVDMKATEATELGAGASEPAAHAQTGQPHDANLRTLLYIEDNPANMMLVEQLIERRPDIRLLTAVNGTLGIDLARSLLPDAILMDINLPGISGIDALKILRNESATAHIPVVALSANAMPRDIKLGLEAGFFRYLTKPIKVKEFMETMDAALEFASEARASAHDSGRRP